MALGALILSIVALGINFSIWFYVFQYEKKKLTVNVSFLKQISKNIKNLFAEKKDLDN